MVKLHEDSSSSSSEDEEENEDEVDDPSDENSDEANDEATEDPVVPVEAESRNSSSVSTFDELGVSSWILRQLSCLGISTPSPVQVQCIPPIMKGNL